MERASRMQVRCRKEKEAQALAGDFNMSMDPWEQTGAAPQGWASHLHQTVLPVQGYTCGIQLRPQDTTLPFFGGCPAATAGTENGPADAFFLFLLRSRASGEALSVIEV